MKSLAVFISVAEYGAFNRAASKLNLQPSVVSHHIAKLEQHLGVSLFYRTTRKVSLTDQGEQLYQAVRPLYRHCELHLAQLAGSAKTPSGKLAVALPQFIPCPKLTAALWQFVKDYPDIQLTLHYSDHRSQLPHSEIDLALRIGQQQDSNLRTLPLSNVRHKLLATPELVATGSENLQEIELLPSITMKLSGEKNIALTNGQLRHSLQLRNIRLRVDSISAAKDAALAGIGFASLPASLCQSEISSGQLVTLLPNWQLAELPICATWSGKARRNSLIKLFVDYLQQQVKYTND